MQCRWSYVDRIASILLPKLARMSSVYCRRSFLRSGAIAFARQVVAEGTELSKMVHGKLELL